MKQEILKRGTSCSELLILFISIMQPKCYDLEKYGSLNSNSALATSVVFKMTTPANTVTCTIKYRIRAIMCCVGVNVSLVRVHTM